MSGVKLHLQRSNYQGPLDVPHKNTGKKQKANGQKQMLNFIHYEHLFTWAQFVEQ